MYNNLIIRILALITIRFFSQLFSYIYIIIIYDKQKKKIDESQKNFKKEYYFYIQSSAHNVFI